MVSRDQLTEATPFRKKQNIPQTHFTQYYQKYLLNEQTKYIVRVTMYSGANTNRSVFKNT